MATTFRVNLISLSAYTHKHPFSVDKLVELANTRSVFFPDFFRSNREFKHGYEFTVDGPNAVYLQNNFTSGDLKFLDVVPVVLSLATVTTNEISDIDSDGTASGGGIVTDDGGSYVTSKGICWSTSESPTIGNDFTENGSGLGSFVSSLSGLSGDVYYVRAYATNSVGTSYGNQVSFQSELSTFATVTTAEITDITFDGRATGGGTVTDEGGSDVTGRGVCYSISELPTIDDDFTEDGTGIGTFVSSLSSLGSDFYYVRAYATNSFGTAYGNQVSFRSEICLVKGTRITLVDGSYKNIEDITYDDCLLVWNFDEGKFDCSYPLWIKKPEVTSRYNLLNFSDGSELKTVNQHRIFSKEQGEFVYPMIDKTVIGTTTFNENGNEVTLTSKKVVCQKIEYYNIITDYHINLFANSILTSCRYNNIYPIKDMKFIKDKRTTDANNCNVPSKYVDGLRLGEQTVPIEITEAYVDRLIRTEVNSCMRINCESR